MTVKNILIAGAAGIALIYWLGSARNKEGVLIQSTQYGGYATDPVYEAETGVYRV
jgi:hypothetical protein